jgi:hypothetical protein
VRSGSAEVAEENVTIVESLDDVTWHFLNIQKKK